MTFSKFKLTTSSTKFLLNVDNPIFKYPCKFPLDVTINARVTAVHSSESLHIVILRQSCWCAKECPFSRIMHQSIPSANIPREISGVLHLLSARVPGFVPSELSGSCPGVGSFIYYHKYQVVVDAGWRQFLALNSSIIYFCFLVTKSASKLGGNFRMIKYGT